MRDIAGGGEFTNDSFQFVIDYVPGYSDSLFICTGGRYVPG